MDFLRDFHVQGHALAAAELPFFDEEELPTPTNNSINRIPPVDATFEAMMNAPSTSPEPVPIPNPAWRTSSYAGSEDVGGTPRSSGASSPTLVDYLTPPYYAYTYNEIDGFWNTDGTPYVDIESEPSGSEIGLPEGMTWRDWRMHTYHPDFVGYDSDS